MLLTRSLYLYLFWRDSVSKHYISNSFFAVEGITLLKGIHFVWYVFVYPCIIWTKSKLIYNHWKALEQCLLMPQTGILYLYLLRRNHILKCYMSISSFADAQINCLIPQEIVLLNTLSYGAHDCSWRWRDKILIRAFKWVQIINC